MTKDKGKKLESKFREAMVALEKSPLFYSYRIPDARTTSTIVNGKMRGRGGSRPGDYFTFYDGRAHLVELKEVQHNSRIPVSRFTQLAKMKRFAMTNNEAGAVVYHTTTGLYRYVPSIWLQAHKKQSSYDLSDVIAYSSLYELCYVCLLGDST